MLQTAAFILGYRPVGEADRIYVLLTEELGKVDALTKSVRKINARLAGHLEPPTKVWVMLVESGRNGGSRWQIAQALEEESYAALRRNPGALKAVFRAAQLLETMLPESAPEPEIWRLWREFLEKITSAESPDFIFSQFACRLLDHLGFFPDPGSIREIPPASAAVLAVILKGVWLPRSSEAARIQAYLEGLVSHASKLMI